MSLQWLCLRLYPLLCIYFAYCILMQMVVPLLCLLLCLRLNSKVSRTSYIVYYLYAFSLNVTLYQHFFLLIFYLIVMQQLSVFQALAAGAWRNSDTTRCGKYRSVKLITKPIEFFSLNTDRYTDTQTDRRPC